MANKAAFNAKYAGDILVWRPVGGDTAVVWKYECPVDSHKVVSAVQLASDLCPVHHAALTGETAVSIT